MKSITQKFPLHHANVTVRSLIWLLLLCPFFFLSYGLANNWAAQQPYVPSMVFDWEIHIPFIAWTIIPYWLIDALYGISLFICISRRELDTHALRLLTAQIIAVTCFILFPLSFTFEQPEISEGIAGFLFMTLQGFDQPYNQAPSLHIALLVILWIKYLQHLPKAWRWLAHVIGLLIGVSVLTTFQHHFIDVPTGMLLGWFCVWLWPDTGKSPLSHMTLAKHAKYWRLAAYYTGGAALLTILALQLDGAGLWLLWPAISLLVVASFYSLFGGAGFQKNENGMLSPAVKWLLWPYLLGARINVWLWTRHDPVAVHVMDGIWLGRAPSGQELENNPFHSVIDVAAELSAPETSASWRAIPNLDLVTPSAAALSEIAKAINQTRRNHPVLVACALGYSRSALAVITWLAATTRTRTVEQAIAVVRSARPRIVIDEKDIPIIETAVLLYQHDGGEKQ